MENLTDLLKKSTAIKNEQGNLAAFDYLKGLVNENNLKENDALRCGKKIASFIKKEKTISIEEATSFFLDFIKERISNKEYKFEFYTTLSDFYFDKKQYDLAFKMQNGALSSVNPYEYSYLGKLRYCFDKMAQITLRLPINEIEKNLEYLVRITSSFLFEVASELSTMTTLGFDRYFDYREYNYNDSLYFSDENFDSSLKALKIYDNKSEIIIQIHKFSIFEIPKAMRFPENVLNGDKKYSNTSNIKLFENTPMILNFTNKLYSQYLK